MKTFVAGDIHGYPPNLKLIINQIKDITDEIDNIVVILAGDVGLEYGYVHNNYQTNAMKQMKKLMDKSGYTWYVMRGNHDDCYWATHQDSPDWTIDDDLMYENAHPCIFYIKDEGGIYTINGQEILFVPGAYSVDKWYRKMNSMVWNPREQLTHEQQDDLIALLDKHGNKVDYVISHTYPKNIEHLISFLFMDSISQNEVDKSMEIFLKYIAENNEFKHWFFGHLHGDKQLTDKYTLLYRNIADIDDYERDLNEG